MRNLFQQVSIIVPSKAIVKISAPNIFLPLYHLISDYPKAHVKHLYPVFNTKKFEKDLDYFLKWYQPISVDDIAKITIKKNKDSKPSLLLSFDDGFTELYDVVAPMLLNKGIPATFFITPSFVDNKQLMFRCKISLIIEKTKFLSRKHLRELFKYLKVKGISDINSILKMQVENNQLLTNLAALVDVDFDDYLKSTKPYLTSNQLLTLYNKRFTIGGHGYNHVYYGSLSSDQQMADITNCMSWINLKYPQKIKLFAFPFTDVGINSQTLKLFHEKKIVDYTFGTSGIRDSIIQNHLQRVPMESNQTSAKKIVEGEILYYLAKQTIGIGKQI